MSDRRQVLEIARWEFGRYFKWRDVAITAVIVVGMAAASYGLSWWQSRSATTAKVAVIAPIAVTAPSPRVTFERHAAAELPELRERVDREDLDGVLVIEPPSVTVIAKSRPSWLGDARAAATGALQSIRLDSLGVSAGDVAAALAPAEVELDLLDGADDTARPSLAAALVVAGMMACLLIGLTHLFVGITGEKQQRVTEQVFVMTTPQALMDGKLLGLGTLAVVSTLQLGVVGLVAYEIFGDGVASSLVAAFSSVGPGQLAALLAFGALGFGFWFALSAAWFASIDDPTSSARSNALMLPLLPLSAAFIGLSDPGSAMMQVLGLVPFTSMTVMPAHMVLAEVSVVEVLASLALLAGSVFALRRAAARAYEAGMLMYGKEPSLREMWRWLRASA